MSEVVARSRELCRGSRQSVSAPSEPMKHHPPCSACFAILSDQTCDDGQKITVGQCDMLLRDNWWGRGISKIGAPSSPVAPYRPSMDCSTAGNGRRS